MRPAHEHENAARYLLVKGQTDLVACRSGILGTDCEPPIPNMEPIGGTGDTLTGIVCSLVEYGIPIQSSSLKAALINRYLGHSQSQHPGPAWVI